MTRAPIAIALDIGGTLAKLALVAPRGRLLAVQTIPTGRGITVPAFLARVEAGLGVLRRAAARTGVRPVGAAVGVPGVVDVRRGIVRYIVNLPAWREIPLRRRLERIFGLPVFVDNDVNLMTWGEFRWGAGRGARSLVCLTLGTGVGGGIVIGGRLYRGWTMSAGEIGHLPLGWNGPRCPCGGRACLERYVGNRAIVALARRKLRGVRRSRLLMLVGGDARRITPPVLDRAARQGDPVARAVWREIGEHLGLALTSVVNLINPDRLVIGGGVAKAGPWLFPMIRATVRARAMRGSSAVRIVPARWGAEAGLVGAAAMIFAPEGEESS